MKKVNFILSVTILCLFMEVMFASCSQSSESSNANSGISYDTIYKKNGYVLLRLKGSEIKGAPGKGFGVEIDDDVAESEIKAYRSATDLDSLVKTRYMDLNFDNVLSYLNTCKTFGRTTTTAEDLGVRIYPAIKKGATGMQDSLILIISPTRDDQALWRQTVSKDIFGKQEDIKAFNTGSLCPVNCALDPDDDLLNRP